MNRLAWVLASALLILSSACGESIEDAIGSTERGDGGELHLAGFDYTESQVRLMLDYTGNLDSLSCGILINTARQTGSPEGILGFVVFGLTEPSELEAAQAEVLGAQRAEGQMADRNSAIRLAEILLDECERAS